MKKKWIILGIGLLLCGSFLLGSRYSIKLRYIVSWPMYFPFHTNIVSNNIEEAKKRGSFIYEYEIPPIIEYNNSPAEIKLEEIFLERIQRYNVFKNKLINRNGYNLVFVYSERGKEIVADWNSQHRYYKLVRCNI